MITAMIGWLDLAAGASGDMLLGALVDAGVPLEVLAGRRRRAAGRADPAGDRAGHPARARRHPRARARARLLARTAPGPTSARCSPTPPLDPAVRDGALAVFERLAVAEGRVHRVSPDEVHFHEVGALDALADVVGVVAGFAHLGLTGSPPPRSRWAAARPAARTASSRSPARPCWSCWPASRSSPAPVPAEMCTPTGAALVAALVDEWTTLPPMRVERVGTGAGGRDPERAAERRPAGAGRARRSGARRAAPSSWRPTSTTSTRGCGPASSTRCSPPGASDAWLTPILMKKGRPAHTLSALCRPEAVPAVQAAVFATTSSIGLRVVPVRQGGAGAGAGDRSTCSAAGWA